MSLTSEGVACWSGSVIGPQVKTRTWVTESVLSDHVWKYDHVWQYDHIWQYEDGQSVGFSVKGIIIMNKKRLSETRRGGAPVEVSMLGPGSSSPLCQGVD